jgi:hypothetical protein
MFRALFRLALHASSSSIPITHRPYRNMVPMNPIHPFNTSPPLSINPLTSISSGKRYPLQFPFPHPFLLFQSNFPSPSKKLSTAIMAIYSNVPPPSQQPAQATVEIKAWTVSALQSLNISPSVRGTGATLSIPLDSDEARKATSYKPRKEPLKRDSQKRREALLKGKEGSRRRQRWENGELCLTRDRNCRLANEVLARSSPPRPQRTASPPLRLGSAPHVPGPHRPLLPRPSLGCRGPSSRGRDR